MNRGPGSAKTDVLFIYTNINGFHSDVYNFGIGYLSSSLKACGFRTALSIVSTRRDYAKMVKTVLRLRPRIIGFSAVSSQFVFVSELAEIIKKVYDCVVVCGGVHPTIFPECLYSSPALDGLFIGESEASFSDFVAHVVKGSDYRKTDNFCYIDASGELVRNKLRSRVKDLETLSPPDRAIYDYQALIDKNGGMATILMSRGCPYSCTYCSNHAIAHVYGVSANTIRYNSIENGIAEISMLRLRYKFKRLWFIDDLFIMNKGWLADFLREYKRNFTIPFVCHIRPNLCTREILFQLKEAGC
jgi:radical SAM superfamily enzyme YgiQ (UPF0313 family)